MKKLACLFVCLLVQQIDDANTLYNNAQQDSIPYLAQATISPIPIQILFLAIIKGVTYLISLYTKKNSSDGL